MGNKSIGYFSSLGFGKIRFLAEAKGTLQSKGSTPSWLHRGRNNPHNLVAVVA